MNFVEPIRDRKKIAQIKNLLRGEGRLRDLLLFTVGINTALRVSDLLRLQVGHFMEDQQAIKKRFQILRRSAGGFQPFTGNSGAGNFRPARPDRSRQNNDPQDRSGVDRTRRGAGAHQRKGRHRGAAGLPGYLVCVRRLQSFPHLQCV